LRRPARLGPLRFNFSSGGLSTISVGGRGASFNIPVSRSGGPRTTAGLPNSRRLRPGQVDALKQSLLRVLRQELFAAGSTGEQLWEHGLVSHLLTDGSLGARTTGLLALIETPEAMEAYVLRSQGQDDAKRRAQRCITAVQEGARLAGARRAGSPYPHAPARTPRQAKDGA